MPGVKQRINKILRRFNVELHGLGYLQALEKKEFQQDEIDFFKKIFANREIVIFDVGANWGKTTRKFLDTFNCRQIYCFEPNVKGFKSLVGQFQDNPVITLLNFGIYDKTGELKFNLNRTEDTSSFLDSSVTGLNSDKHVETVQVIKVPVQTIAGFAKDRGIEKINLLKLDIQGSELKALEGAASLLKEAKIDIIFTETYFIQQYVNQPLFPEIVAFLKMFGYEIQDIYNPVYGHGKLAWCDTIFIKPGLKINW